VLAGSEDNMISPASSSRTAAAYGTDVRFFDGTGHMMMLEHSWRQVLEAIRDWCLGLAR
jgi:pimeloyl-ACP methyl ester carboxylesterase